MDSTHTSRQSRPRAGHAERIDASRPKIFQVHDTFSGSSGFYVDGIVKALEHSYDQVVFVNYYYTWNASRNYRKIFYRLSENVPVNPFLKILGPTRRYVRLLEKALGYVRVLYSCYRERPALINYSLVDTLFVTRWFLRILALLPRKPRIVVTVHDVFPYQMRVFGKDYSSDEQMNVRKKMFRNIDYVIVHDRATSGELIRMGVQERQMLFYPLPLSPRLGPTVPRTYQAMVSRIAEARTNAKTIFAFAGHIRHEKGIGVLLDAWEVFARKNRNAHLFVVGRPIAGVHIDEERVKRLVNITMELRYIDDDELYALIDETDYFILPYTQVTNSAVLFQVASRGGIPVVSQLKPFVDTGLTFEELTFEANDVQSLADCLHHCLSVSGDQHARYKELMKSKLIAQNRMFVESIHTAYERIM